MICTLGIEGGKHEAHFHQRSVCEWMTSHLEFMLMCSKLAQALDQRESSELDGCSNIKD